MLNNMITTLIHTTCLFHLEFERFDNYEEDLNYNPMIEFNLLKPL